MRSHPPREILVVLFDLLLTKHHVSHQITWHSTKCNSNSTNSPASTNLITTTLHTIFIMTTTAVVVNWEVLSRCNESSVLLHLLPHLLLLSRLLHPLVGRRPHDDTVLSTLACSHPPHSTCELEYHFST